MLSPESIRYDFFAIGEALIDFISENIADSLAYTSVFNRFVGGQPANLTMTMARLGNRVAIATCVGRDDFGTYILEQLQEAGVETDYVQFTPNAPTTLAINTRHTVTPSFAIYRGADTLLQPDENQQSAALQSRVVHTSAFALAREPARSAIMQTINYAHQQGNLVTLDPNYHPRNWPDIPDFIDTLKNIFQFVDVTKPSIEDCARLFGPGLDLRDYAHTFLEWGAKVVLITQGSKGVFLATSQGDQYHIHANPIQVMDVTGAGDAFWAGYLTACLGGAPPLESARFGQVVAEFKLGSMGPIVKLPTRASLSTLAQAVQYSPTTE